MDNYLDLKSIGEGSFGKVFKGRRKQTGQIVAIKFIKKKLDNKRQDRQGNYQSSTGNRHPQKTTSSKHNFAFGLV